MKRKYSAFFYLLLFAATAVNLLTTSEARAASVSTNDVVRYLNQSSFGATSQSIARVKQIGIAAHLGEQLTAPMLEYPVMEFWPSTRPDTCTNTAPSTCQRDNYSYYLLQKHFFTNALYGQDQLRQRVAFALSQILVTSSSDIPLPAWMRTYQQLLYASALGNFRQLLYDVTLNPAMGRFLDMVNNRCQNRVPTNINVCLGGSSFLPNENYAREIQQLFSVGTFVLNPDGTDQTDGQGSPVFTYTQQDITEFSRVFTGWILAPSLPAPPTSGIIEPVPNYRDPMIPRLDSLGREVGHDRGPKTLLRGQQIQRARRRRRK